MKKVKKPNTIPPILIDGTKVTLKKATVEDFLTAAEKFKEFKERHPNLIEGVVKSEAFNNAFDDLYDEEQDKAFNLYFESDRKITAFAFMDLADACYDVLGPVVEVRETYYKMLQLLGIEVAE